MDRRHESEHVQQLTLEDASGSLEVDRGADVRHPEKLSDEEPISKQPFGPTLQTGCQTGSNVRPRGDRPVMLMVDDVGIGLSDQEDEHEDLPGPQPLPKPLFGPVVQTCCTLSPRGDNPVVVMVENISEEDSTNAGKVEDRDSPAGQGGVRAPSTATTTTLHSVISGAELTRSVRIIAQSIWSRGPITRSFFMGKKNMRLANRTTGSEPTCGNVIRTLPGFLGAVLLVSTVSCTLAFVALPVSNPLAEDNHWHCALTCTLVWVPLSILFEGLLLQEMMYRPLGQTIPKANVVIMWAVQSGCMSIVLVLLSVFWVNPAPMNGALGALTGILANSLMIFFVFVPQLGKAVGLQVTTYMMRQGNPLFEIQRAAVTVTTFFVVGVAQLMVGLTISASLLKLVEHWYLSVFVLSVVRAVYVKCLGSLAELMHPEALPLGTSMAMITTGVATAITVGSADSWEFTLLFFLCDMMMAVFWTLSLSNLTLCGINIGEMLLMKAEVCKSLIIRQRIPSVVSTISKDKARDRMLALLISAELAEVIVAMSYSICWLVVQVGPNAGSFSGNGTSDFGLQVPDHVLSFLGNIALLFVCECISMWLLKRFIARCLDVVIEIELQAILNNFGPVLVAQSSWLIVTSFCMTMIHCGLDYSLKWDYL